MIRHDLWFSIGICFLFVVACGEDTATTDNIDTVAPPGDQADSSMDGIPTNSGTATEAAVADPALTDALVTETEVSDASVATSADPALTDALVTETEVADASVATSADTDASLSLTSFQGFEELYIMSNDDDPTDICRVRYELVAVDEPAIACPDCNWDVVVQKQNPRVITNVDNACANSDLGLDEAAIAAKEGERVAYGYISEYFGHANVLQHLDDDSGTWEALTNANWDEQTGDLFYDRRDGFCDYGGTGADFENSGICGLSGEAVVKD